MEARTKQNVVEYVELESDEKVMHAKIERSFADLDQSMNVWNVKTDKGAWWVVEGEHSPMNLYTQDATYFSADEVYSFHTGIMWRLLTRQTGDPRSFLGTLSYSPERFASARRKLEEAAASLTGAVESEHLQAVGLMCRESLVALAKELIIGSDLPEGVELPKLGDFKSRAKLAIDRLLDGPDNRELRSHGRKICDAAWEFSSSLTHSSTRAFQDAAICISLTGAVHSLFENLIEKFEGAPADLECPVCHSRRLEVSKTFKNKNTETVLHVLCAHCGWEEYHNLDEEP